MIYYEICRESAMIAPPAHAPQGRGCLGKEIYQRGILPPVEADRFGEYVAIDVDSGNRVVADREIAAAERMRAMCLSPSTS